MLPSPDLSQRDMAQHTREIWRVFDLVYNWVRRGNRAMKTIVLTID
jgi:hypothetical protein